MDEEKLNISIRKFLKGVGINSQRIIEKRIRDIVANDKNVNLSNVKITMQIKSTELQIDEKIDGKIDVD
jgi:type IV pilus biogenesis protein CpaD/CtpE